MTARIRLSRSECRDKYSYDFYAFLREATREGSVHTASPPVLQNPHILISLRFHYGNVSFLLVDEHWGELADSGARSLSRVKPLPLRLQNAFDRFADAGVSSPAARNVMRSAADFVHRVGHSDCQAGALQDGQVG